MARFTVLGANGFIGTHLVRHLRARGLDVSAPPRGEAVPQGNLGHIAYCIGLTADYLKRPFDTVEAHVSLFSRVLREVDFESLVYLSSTRLYDTGGTSGREDDDLILNPGNSRHLYDLSKGLGEALCQVCGNGKARVARLSCVYSDDLAADTFLHQLVQSALREGNLTVESSAGNARDYIHVEDVCEAIVEIALNGRRPIYNVASGANVTNRDLFQWVERHTGCRITVTEPLSKGSESAPVIDVSALREDFGLSPRSLRDALPLLVTANGGHPTARVMAI